MEGRANILGVLVDRVRLSEVEERIDDFVRSSEPHQIVTVNMDFISQALRDTTFKDLINSSSLSVADGMPVVWAGGFLGQPIPQRITGMDLLDISCRLARHQGAGIFLLGAAPGVASQAGKILCSRYPGLHIAGTYAPPFGRFVPEENRRMVDSIVASEAKYLFVAFGCPKQDFWLCENLQALHVPVCVGIGGVFDYITGRSRRAPAWVQNMGFEWLFRTVQQPNRLAKRYLIDDLPLLFKVVIQKLSSADPANDWTLARPGQEFHGSVRFKRIGPRT